MVPSYDFDIRWLSPREAEDDPAVAQALSDNGSNGTSRGNYIALFRDPQVIAMIERADPVLRAYLKASGFGFAPSHSGAPAGRFPADDRVARTNVFARLDTNLSKFDLKDADLGGFDFAAFLKAIVEGQPLQASDLPEGPARAPAGPPPARQAMLAEPGGEAKLGAHQKVMPLMLLALAATLGISLLIQQLGKLQAGL